MTRVQRWIGVSASAMLIGLPENMPAAGQAQSPPGPPPAAAARVCGTQPFCAEAVSFAAAITDFQALLQNTNNKTLTMRLRVHNKLNRPLTLGYVSNSGVATDERGNRYAITERAIQGMGVIQGNSADSKFQLQVGEASDARFEFAWNTSGREIFGITFQIDLAVREIDVLPSGQMRLGREHALHFTGLSNRGTAARAGAPTAGVPSAVPSATGPPPIVAAAASPAASAPPPGDACAGRSQCYSAGLFAADVTDVISSLAGYGGLQLIQVRVRFKNMTKEPLRLGYVGNSAVATDNYGGRYDMQQTAYGAGVKGMGVVQRGEADSQFVIGPATTSDAVFTLARGRNNDRRDPIGTEFRFDLSTAQLEVLPSLQVRTVREYAVGFTGLSPTSVSAATPSPDPCGPKPKCYGTASFTSEITGLTASFGPAQAIHLLQAKVRFTNLTNQPLILGYLSGSAVAIDNYGGRYTLGQPAYGDGVKGIGVVRPNEAESDFVLRPGASADATFAISRPRKNDRTDPIGKTFDFEMAIAELEVLPSQQIHTVREYAVGFARLSASGPSLLQQILKPPKGGGR